jgi:hypothetical protein
MLAGGVLATGSKAEGGNSNAIRGDYVEARTASVFAGACHYNGELTTSGRDALMAWKVSSGSWNGVDLSGVRALAVVSSSANLAERKSRRSELIISDEATYAQAIAMVHALKSKHAQSLGEIVAVKRAPLSFLREGKSYSVASAGVAAIDVEAMPDDLCCRMPQLVWYEPLVSLTQRKVGYTRKAFFSGDVISEPWERSGENSAFYGTFSF